MSYLGLRSLVRHRRPGTICNLLSNQYRTAKTSPAVTSRTVRFLSSSSLSQPNTNAVVEGKDSILSLPTQFLRAMDSTNYDENTLQRNDVPFDINTGKPILQDAPIPNNQTTTTIKTHDFDGKIHRIFWEDCHESEFSEDWVRQQQQHWTGESLAVDRVLWTDMTEDKLRSSSELAMPHSDVLTDDGMRSALRTLYRYGILLVTETPTSDDGLGVAALASVLGGGKVKNQTTILNRYLGSSDDGCGGETILPRWTDGPLRTLYGTVWSTTSAGQDDGASVADSAYGSDGLPLHTDMTYQRDPPGLQIFTMVRPAMKGGESIFADGFAAAERLRNVDPVAFDTLSTTIRRYRCIDLETGWHLEASGPVISVHNGKVVAIRHNDLDRCPDLPPPDSTPDQVDEFYDNLERAHRAWDHILSQDDLRLEVALQKGDTVVVANQRCFHARRSFQTTTESPRYVIGCYVCQDELYSRFRMEGYDVL